MIGLWIATLETRHFTFEGTGASEGEAVDVLKQGLRRHAEQVGISAAWFEPLDCNVRHYERGRAFRDGGEL